MLVYSCLCSGSRSGVDPNIHLNNIINVIRNILCVRHQEEAKNQVYLQSLDIICKVDYIKSNLCSSGWILTM